MAEDESSAVENNGNRPIFAGKGKRSRKGCLTCTQSKVKCSERHPICDRCSRTRRQCVWPGTKPSLQIRRRGAGPYKDRAMMNPRPIVPDAQPPVQTTSPQDGTPVTTSNFSNHQKATSSYAEMHVTDEFQSHFPSTPWVEAESAVALLAAVPKVASDQGMYQRITLPSPTASSSLAAHIHSRSSVIIGRPEWEALQFFEGVFARVYSPKPFTWSHLGVISHFGKQDGAVQHLIVATCLGQLDKTSSDGAFWRLGKKHFQTGAQLVIQEIKKSELDHCKIFIAFWLLQVTYNTYWGDKAAESLSKLSLAMAQYVRKHQLLDTFKAKNPSNYSREALGMVTDKERSLLARLLIFSLYEDIDADFCHAGGAFAAELCSDPSVITAVYLPSKDCLSHYFGPMYPHEELMDDVQRSNLLELHFEANMTLQTINAASNNNAPRSEFEKIARRMEDLKLRHLSAFQLTQIVNDGNTKVLSSANNVVAHFLAVEVYNFQCLQAETRDCTYAAELHRAITQLLHTIGNLCREYPMNMPYRNQWLFFMAGIGTSDPIHVAWITDKLKQGRYYRPLKKAIDMQRLFNFEMSIADVRSLFWGFEDGVWEARNVKSLEDDQPGHVGGTFECIH